MITLRPIRQEDIFSLMDIMEANNDSTRVKVRRLYLKEVRGKPVEKGFDLVALYCKLKKISDVHDFAILLDDKLIGVTGYCKEKGRYDLSWFHVTKEHQGKGYGSQALAEIEKILTKPCEVKVDTGYTKAVKFYEKHGYIVVKIVPHYYPQGDDNYVMTKMLL